MTWSMIVRIPNLAHTYMEPMETATSNIHASGLTYSPQCGYISPQPNAEPVGGLSQLPRYWAWMGVMPWPCP